jgi:hypothetical protein
MRLPIAVTLALSIGSSAAAADTAGAWLCRPGAEEPCVEDLNALEVDAHGKRTPAPFVEAKDAPIDCFYVYPTVSSEKGPYADTRPSAEIVAAAHGQAGAFASKCRLFAPLYRQLTLPVLLGHEKTGGPPLSYDAPYQDVLAAWRSYLQNDNHGRGVVLIGDDQGAILLQRLLAEEIDGKPEQKLLVSALLGGDPGFGVPPGKDVGGTLKSIPLCRTADQTGCVMVWASYVDTDASKALRFGRSPAPGLAAACTNPAALGGGSAPIRSVMHRPADAPKGDPPYVIAEGQLSARCVDDPGGATLRVHIEYGKNAYRFKEAFAALPTPTGWGLHVIDYNLVLEDLVDDVGAEAGAWTKTHPTA